MDTDRSVYRRIHIAGGRRKGWPAKGRQLVWLTHLERGGQHQLDDHVQRKVKRVRVQQHVRGEPPSLHPLTGVVDQPPAQRRFVSQTVYGYLSSSRMRFHCLVFWRTMNIMCTINGEPCKVSFLSFLKEMLCVLVSIQYTVHSTHYIEYLSGSIGNLTKFCR